MLIIVNNFAVMGLKLINKSKLGYSYFDSLNNIKYSHIIKRLNREYIIICTGSTLHPIRGSKDKVITYSYKLFKNYKEVYEIKDVRTDCDLHKIFKYYDPEYYFIDDEITVLPYVNKMKLSYKYLSIETKNKIKIFRFKDNKEYTFDKTSDNILNYDNHVRFNNTTYNINTMKENKYFYSFSKTNIIQTYYYSCINIYDNIVYDDNNNLLLKDINVKKISPNIIITSKGIYKLI